VARQSFAVVAGCLALVGFACGDHGAASRDAGADAIKADVTSPLSISISVTGCATYDPTVPLCAGPPPLTLSFAPVGSSELTQFLWNFGDDTPETSERAPSHTYAHVGEYAVIVKGGAGANSVSPPDPLKIRVDALATGAACDVDAQCSGGLTCTCAQGTGCAPAFIRGVCSAPCETAACQPDAVCAAVTVDAGAPSRLCLASCEAAACGPGFVCRTLPVGSVAPSTRWTRGCLPLGLVGDVGASCRDPNEALADRACATGTCADVGALGVCSADCDDARSCPTQASCARLADGRQLCLLSCRSDADCGGDPLVACAQTPAASMDADGGTAGSTVSVCAPRSCANDNACPSGRCGPNAFCVRK
jgi:hypothetical protein